MLLLSHLPNWIPPALHRQLYRLANAVRRQVWALTKPRLRGARIVVVDARDRVLLVRHSYGSPRWMPPGGGLGRREDAVQGAIREVAEEVGCTLTRARLVAVFEEPLYGATNCAHIVVGRADDEPRPDGREVVEARWFALDAMPEYIWGSFASDIPAWVELWRAQEADYSSES